MAKLQDKRPVSKNLFIFMIATNNQKFKLRKYYHLHASKNVKYLGINLTKDEQYLNNENYKF